MKNNISKFSDCFNCGLCGTVCPQNIVSIRRNPEGFYSPLIMDEEKCTECGLCLKVCAFNTPLARIEDNTDYFSAWSNNKVIRATSSSGGIAYELSRQALKHGFKIIAVKFDAKSGYAMHYIAECQNELLQSQGSKYVQSLTHFAIKSIEKGERYMVFGTPCQIHSLRNLICMKHIQDDFILVDFFCHGIPSYNLLDKYIAERQGVTGKVHDVVWRDKSNGGWHNSWNMIISGENNETRCSIKDGDLFYRFFLKNRCLNEACYKSCKYKLDSSAADIRLGDLWGSKYESNNEGVSGVMVLTVKGKEVIASLDNCTFNRENKDIVQEAQMKIPAKKPASCNYVKSALQTGKTLIDIDKNASRREFWGDKLPWAVRYYPKRIIQKMIGK